MTRSHRLKAMGLCLMMALGLLAFAGSAQATVGSKWMVNGADITTNVLLPQVQITEIENKTASLLFTTGGGTKVEILCTNAELINVKLKAEGSLTEGSVKFSGCLTKLNGSTSGPCKPFTGAESGVVKTEKGLGLIILHEGAGLTLIKPETGTLLATIELGEECSIGESVPVAGELVLKDAAFTTEAAEHLIAEGPLTSLTALGQPATIDGSAWVKLVGTGHEGLKWSGLPA
jgi:hypothetical protein